MLSESNFSDSLGCGDDARHLMLNPAFLDHICSSVFFSGKVFPGLHHVAVS